MYKSWTRQHGQGGVYGFFTLSISLSFPDKTHPVYEDAHRARAVQDVFACHSTCSAQLQGINRGEDSR